MDVYLLIYIRKEIIMNDVIEDVTQVDMKCIIARLIDGDDLPWGTILSDNIKAEGTILALAPNGVVFLSGDDRSVLVFDKDNLIYIGKADTLTAELPFLSISFDQETTKHKINMELMLDNQLVDANYDVRSMTYDNFTTRVAFQYVPYQVAIKLGSGENWKQFITDGKMIDVNFILYAKDSVILVTDDASSVWILHDDMIVYLGSKAEFNRRSDILTLDSVTGICTVHNATYDVTVPYTIIVEEEGAV